jgi:hypothetical protein
MQPQDPRRTVTNTLKPTPGSRARASPTILLSLDPAHQPGSRYRGPDHGSGYSNSGQPSYRGLDHRSSKGLKDPDIADPFDGFTAVQYRGKARRSDLMKPTIPRQVPGLASQEPRVPGLTFQKPRVPGLTFQKPRVPGPASQKPRVPGPASQEPGVPAKVRVPINPGDRKRALGLKQIAKQAVHDNFTTRIDEIGIREIRSICRGLVKKMNITTDRERLEVQATVLGVVIKNTATLPDGHAPYIHRIAPMIQELHHANPLSKKEIHDAKGYDMLNHYLWCGVTQVNDAGYCEGIEALITVCLCDVLAKNTKGETALESYSVACRQGKAPQIDAVRDVLRGKIRPENLRKMVQMMINKCTPGNASKFGNIFKLAFLRSIDQLATTLIDNLLQIRGLKTKNLYPSVTTNLDMYRTMLRAPINDDECKPELLGKFQDPDTAYIGLLDRLVPIGLARFAEFQDKESKQSKSMPCHDHEVQEIQVTGIDTIGAMIGEISGITHNTAYCTLLVSQFPTLETTDSQNICLTATAHLLARLGQANKSRLLTFMTPRILEGLENGAKRALFKTRVIFAFEAIIQAYLGMHVPCQEFTRITRIITGLDQDDPDIMIREPRVMATSRTTGKARTKTRNKTRNKARVKMNHQVQDQAQDQDQVQDQDQAQDPVDEQQAINDPVDPGTLIDIEKYKHLTPRCFTTVIRATKNGPGEWSDPGVDDWAYGIQRDIKQRSQDELKVLINTIVFMMTNDILLPRDTAPGTGEQKLNTFKLVMDDIFSEPTIARILQDLAVTLTIQDPDEIMAMWENAANFNYFKSLMTMYGIKHEIV